MVREGKPALQRSTGFAYLNEGDPAAPFTNKAKGTHDYILVPQFDPAPKGYKDYVHPVNGGKWYQKLSAATPLPRNIELSRGNAHGRAFALPLSSCRPSCSTSWATTWAIIHPAQALQHGEEQRAHRQPDRTPAQALPGHHEDGRACGEADYKTWEELDTAGSAGVKEQDLLNGTRT